MHRFFVPKNAITDGTAQICGDDVAHITKVLRLKENDSIILCDGEKSDYYCTISQVDKACIHLKVEREEPNRAESDLNITLYQGLPKSDKMDFIIQKAVELGASKIVPVESARCVAKMKDNDKKRARWQKIAEEAAKQCGRGIIPSVGDAITFSQAINQAHEAKIMPYECEQEGSLSNFIECNPNCRDMAIYIGPEGGFEAAEADEATANGVKTVTLGKRILRCETAGIATVAAVMYAYGQWN